MIVALMALAKPIWLALSFFLPSDKSIAADFQVVA
jgi:hypothetical protein